MSKLLSEKPRILIIQQKMIGDVLTCSVLFEILRKKFPDAQLDYLINSSTFPVVMNHPHIDNFIFFDEKRSKEISYLRQLAKKIKANRYNVVIDAYSKLSSNFLTFFSGAPVRISYSKWYSDFIYTKTYKSKKKAETKAGLAIENRIALLQEIVEGELPLVAPKIYLTEEEEHHSKKLLIQKKIDLNRPLVMMSILGSSPSKTYPEKYMAEIIDQVSETVPRVQILFNYLPKQKQQAQKIYDLCSPAAESKIRLEIYGENLREFITICANCTAVIGNEGGAINMGKALNIKTFSIFSPWINQEAWNLFEDGKNNDSVHLKNYFPELYDNTNKKELKKQIEVLYLKFKPDLFKEKYLNFVNRLKQTHSEF